jgi:hypothetical protein
MNIIILDSETEIPLYGLVLLDVIKSTRRGSHAKVYRIPAEAWIAYLQTRHSHVPEVQAYLKAVDAEEGINPQEGKLLKAVDEAIEVSEHDADEILRIVEVGENGAEPE